LHGSKKIHLEYRKILLGKKYNLPTPADPKLSRAQDSPLQLTGLLDAASKN